MAGVFNVGQAKYSRAILLMKSDDFSASLQLAEDTVMQYALAKP